MGNMTEAMESLAEALTLNRVPANWGVFYLSKKPLNSWWIDLASRCKQLVDWTTVMQNTARGEKLPLDEMCTQTHVPPWMDYTTLKTEPENGSYVHGFFLEGSAWEQGDEGTEGYLIEQKLKELHPQLPV